MSQENIEIVREMPENWNRGDLYANLEYLDDDVVLRAAEGWPETAFHGKREVQSFFWNHADALIAAGLSDG